jgi:hypothetical protein
MGDGPVGKDVFVRFAILSPEFGGLFPLFSLRGHTSCVNTSYRSVRHIILLSLSGMNLEESTVGYSRILLVLAST